jgi:hypothetical protein
MRAFFGNECRSQDGSGGRPVPGGPAFRLNTIEIHLPPLRERREDILACEIFSG